MGTFDEDGVRIKLAGQTIPIYENYRVRCGVLEVPAQFEITVGHGGMFSELAATYPPLTPFELYIGDKKVQEGETDGYGNDPEKTSMAMTGRDYLARLQDHEILDERSFAEKTYTDLTKTALEAVGLGDRTLVALNSANRKAITGKESRELEKHTIEDQTETGSSPDKTVIEVRRTLKGESGTRWLEFLVEQYRRAGLFLWSDHSGNFVLSQPNAAQSPLYRILRRRGSLTNEVSALGIPTVHNDVRNRFTEYRVVGRAGGGKHGRAAILGKYIDEEMVALRNARPEDRANGGKLRKVQTIRDTHVRSVEQANYLARRKCAEARRNGWKCTYRVGGHSTPAIGGGRAVWAPDTVVEVLDDELGLTGVMYLESVTFVRDGEATYTDLHVMRIEDLIFAEEAPEVVKKRPKLQVRRGVTTVERPSFQLQGVSILGNPVSQKTVWTTDPNVSVGAPVVINPDEETNLQQTTKVTSKPFTLGSQADVGVAGDDPNPQYGWPSKPGGT